MGRGPGVRSRGTSIQIDFRYRGVRVRESLRLEPTRANLKFAANLKARLEHEIAVGTFDYAKYFPDSKRAQGFDTSPRGSLQTVSEHVHAWVNAHHAEVTPETLHDYREYAVIVGKTEWGQLPLRDLRERHVRDWVTTLKVGRKRVVNLLTPVRGALARAKSDEVIEANPLAGFRVGRRKATEAEADIQEKVDPLTPAELKQIGKQANGDLWTFWGWTGLRTGEVIALQWDDVSADYAHLRVRRSIRSRREKRPKTDSGLRTVPLLAPAAAVLRRLERQDGQKIFRHPRTKRPFPGDDSIRDLFHADCAAAEVRRRRGSNQLRHTFASIALSSGEPVAWVSKVLGHASIWHTLDTYAKWVPEADPTVGTKMLRHAEGKSRKKPRKK